MRIISTFLFMLLPLISFAQASGGQIKRNKIARTIKQPVNKQIIPHKLRANDKTYLNMSMSALEKKADQGDIWAMFYIGYNYVQKEKYKIALEWFRKAAYHDLEMAQLWLAYCYYNGKGAEKDVHLAKSWLEVAAKNGSEDAEEYLDSWYNN